VKALALLVPLLAWPSFGWAAPSLEQLDAASRSTHTLTASLEQTSKVKLFKQVLVQKGRLAFRAPRQIRWEYTSPDPSLLVLDGNRATMTTPGAAPQVFDLAKDATMGAIFDQLLTFVGGGSLSRAETAYALTLGGSDQAPTVTLVPKPGTPADKIFQRIVLSFDKALVVDKIDLLEKSGDDKTIVFTKIVRNGALADDLFAPR
jgi:outer membrane lipoprotein-sorting protein